MHVSQSPYQSNYISSLGMDSRRILKLRDQEHGSVGKGTWCPGNPMTPPGGRRELTLALTATHELWHVCTTDCKCRVHRRTNK